MGISQRMLTVESPHYKESAKSTSTAYLNTLISPHTTFPFLLYFIISCFDEMIYVPDGDRTDTEAKIYRQIQIDVPRTNPNVGLFQQPEVQKLLERILYIWAIRHPASVIIYPSPNSSPFLLSQPFSPSFIRINSSLGLCSGDQ